MITEQGAVEELVLKLKILEKYPKTDAGEEALIEALRTAETKLQAEQFIKGWIRTNRKCPMPCDIYQALDTGALAPAFRNLPVIPAGAPIPPPEYRCDQCQDSGWYIVPTKKEIPDLPGQYYTAAKRCSHPPDRRGALATSDRRLISNK